VRELGNARLITTRGDGHTAYGGNSAARKALQRLHGVLAQTG